jgi:DNA-binding NarL/FixJ family response regulator
MRVLIADNSELIVQRLEELLSESTFILMTDRAYSYEAAQQLFTQNKPDVVVLDINLPGYTSYRLLKEIKEEAPQTVVIVMSICLDECMLQQCTNLGADFFFDKYHEFEKIPAIISGVASKLITV